jgi:hypothetical protein
MFVLAASWVAGSQPATALTTAQQYKVVGSMPWPENSDGIALAPRMLIDKGLQKGFVTPLPSDMDHIWVFDLATRSFLTSVSTPLHVDGSGDDGFGRSTIDGAHHRIFYPVHLNYFAGSGACNASNLATSLTIQVLSTQPGADGKYRWSMLPNQCLATGDPLHIVGMSYDEGLNRLFVARVRPSGHSGSAASGSTTTRSPTPGTSTGRST